MTQRQHCRKETMGVKDPSMKLTDVSDWRMKLRTHLLAEIHSFEQRSGCVVESIDLEHISRGGPFRETNDVKIEISI
jgi:hypothetical protein